MSTFLGDYDVKNDMVKAFGRERLYRSLSSDISPHMKMMSSSGRSVIVE